MKTVRCRKVEGGFEDVPVEALSFRVSVYGVIIEKGNILLLPSWDGYDFPGGKIELGETLPEAFTREVKEETGMDATIGEHLLTTSDFFLHPLSKKPFHSFLFFHTHASIIGELSVEGFDEFEKQVSKKARWVPLDEALTAKFYNPVDSPALIKKALAILG